MEPPVVTYVQAQLDFINANLDVSNPSVCYDNPSLTRYAVRFQDHMAYGPYLASAPASLAAAKASLIGILQADNHPVNP